MTDKDKLKDSFYSRIAAPPQEKRHSNIDTRDELKPTTTFIRCIIYTTTLTLLYPKNRAVYVHLYTSIRKQRGKCLYKIW